MLLDPKAREAAGLESMDFDDVLSWLRVVGAAEQFELTSLVDAARRAPATSTLTAVELHLGASEVGDVHEGELLHDAICARAAGGLSCTMHVHANRGHNLVLQMRDSGQLHERLRGWLGTTDDSHIRTDDSHIRTDDSHIRTDDSDEDVPPPAVAARPAAQPRHATEPIVLADGAAASIPPGAAAELAAVEASLRARPTDAVSWLERARLLGRLHRFIDGLVSLMPLTTPDWPVKMTLESREAAAALKSTLQEARRPPTAI